MATLIDTLPPHSGCPICRQPEVTEILIGREAKDAIVREVEWSIAAETGGILLGYIDDNRKAIVTRATGPGVNAQQSPSIFRRDVDFVQSELDRARTELGERGLYLGEWHSHLIADPHPSATDLASLNGIATAYNYLTRSPVMIIAGLDPATHQCASLKGWSFQVQGSVSEIEVNEMADVSL
jgi:integrative and conjugative element protein (TIGR02256 family)